MYNFEAHKKKVIECASKLYTDWEYYELKEMYPLYILNEASEIVDLIDNEYPWWSFEHAFNFLRDIDNSNY